MGEYSSLGNLILWCVVAIFALAVSLIILRRLSRYFDGWLAEKERQRDEEEIAQQYKVVFDGEVRALMESGRQ